MGINLTKIIESIKCYKVNTKSYRDVEESIFNQLPGWLEKSSLDILVYLHSEMKSFLGKLSYDDVKSDISIFFNKMLNTRRMKRFFYFFKIKSDFVKYYKETNKDSVKNILEEMSKKPISSKSALNKKNIKKILRIFDFFEINDFEVSDKKTIICRLDDFSKNLLDILKEWKKFRHNLTGICDIIIRNSYILILKSNHQKVINNILKRALLKMHRNKRITIQKQ